VLEKARETENETLRRLTELLARAAKPKYIILFGSQARGEGSEDSDFDVMVVEPEVANRGEEMVRLGRLVRSLDIGRGPARGERREVRVLARHAGQRVLRGGQRRQDSL